MPALHVPKTDYVSDRRAGGHSGLRGEPESPGAWVAGSQAEALTPRAQVTLAYSGKSPSRATSSHGLPGGWEGVTPSSSAPRSVPRRPSATKVRRGPPRTTLAVPSHLQEIPPKRLALGLRPDARGALPRVRPEPHALAPPEATLAPGHREAGLPRGAQREAFHA